MRAETPEQFYAEVLREEADEAVFHDLYDSEYRWCYEEIRAGNRVQALEQMRGRYRRGVRGAWEAVQRWARRYGLPFPPDGESEDRSLRFDG